MFRMLISAVMLGFVLGDRLGDRLELLRYLVRTLEDERQTGVIYDAEGLSGLYNDVRSNDTVIRWCTAVYVERLIHLGPCGQAYSGFLEQLSDDERIYAYVRFETGDGAKFAFITWIGGGVRPLLKARVSTDKAFVRQQWPEYDREILADEISDVEEDRILQILQTASGAA